MGGIFGAASQTETIRRERGRGGREAKQMASSSLRLSQNSIHFHRYAC